jgi:hypothetical protein
LWTIANFRKLKKKNCGQWAAFWCKGWFFKKVNPKDWPSDKMVQILATIQKHGKQKKLLYSWTISIPCSFTYVCTKLVYVILDEKHVFSTALCN